ncbi:MAG TPA: hypothetical protein VD906_01470 [Caulobacteraceae bacterium]|nr:hypothetical protein [Caulobacteraceae bacterium]
MKLLDTADVLTDISANVFDSMKEASRASASGATEAKTKGPSGVISVPVNRGKRGPEPDFVIQTNEGTFAIEAKVLQNTLSMAVSRVFGGADRVLVLHLDEPDVAKAIAALLEQLPEHFARAHHERSEQRIEQLVSHFMDVDPIASTRRAVELDNAQARARLLEQLDVLTAKDVARLAGHSASNTSATASKWKGNRAIFSVSYRGKDLYPAFQFKDGRPLPIIGKILRELPKTMSAWQIAFWFASVNGWLAGRAPMAALDDEAAVLSAARRQAEPVVG